MTREELAGYDGREGRRAYVAVSGKIYDLTGSPMWPGGSHAGLHQAGEDLTAALAKAPHVRAVVERFPVAGDLVEPVVAKKAPWGRLVAAAAAAAAILSYLFAR
jgi:predicted heme/steroid binding protein